MIPILFYCKLKPSLQITKTEEDQTMKPKLLFIFTVLFFINSLSGEEDTQCAPNLKGLSSEYCCFHKDDPVVTDYRNGYSEYHYATLGVGPIIFVPNLGIGYRKRYAHYGWDVSAGFSTIGYAHSLTAQGVGHYYFSPFQKNTHYIGAGLLSGLSFTKHDRGIHSFSPLFVYGKEFRSDSENKHFIEMHVALPTCWKDGRRYRFMYFPVVYIKYGVAF